MLKRWGWHLPVLKGKHWKIKLLYFKPDGAISYQRHSHRSELWLFVFGGGSMKLDGAFCHICAGDVFHVDRQEWHQYKAEKRTFVVEIQYGDQCIESDIERSA